MMTLFYFAACTEKEHISYTEENTVVESRSNNLCEFYYCSGPWVEDAIPYVFKGCTLSLFFKYRQCFQAIELKDFGFAFGTGSKCDSIRNSWGQLYQAGNTVQANNNYNQLYKVLTLGAQNYVASLFDLSDFDPHNVVIIGFNFIETKCHTLCVDTKYDEEGIVISYDLSYVVCGESCCIRNTDIDFDGSGNIILGDSEITENTPCDPVTVNCRGSYNPNICNPACDRL